MRLVRSDYGEGYRCLGCNTSHLDYYTADCCSFGEPRAPIGVLPMKSRRLFTPRNARNHKRALVLNRQVRLWKSRPVEDYIFHRSPGEF